MSKTFGVSGYIQTIMSSIPDTNRAPPRAAPAVVRLCETQCVRLTCSGGEVWRGMGGMFGTRVSSYWTQHTRAASRSAETRDSNPI